MSATIPSTMLLSDLLKATGYNCPEDLQGKTFEEATAGGTEVVLEDNKTATITANGTIEITPTAGKDAMKKVTATVNVPSSGVTKLYGFVTENTEAYCLMCLSTKPFSELHGGDTVLLPTQESISKHTILETSETTITVSTGEGTYEEYSPDASKDITL